MTPDESTDFIERLLVAFPDINEWMAKNSPDPPATLSTWQETLAHVPYDVAKAVLVKMVNGELEAVRAYERGSTAILVKRYCDEATARQSREQENEVLLARGKRWLEMDGDLPRGTMHTAYEEACKLAAAMERKYGADWKEHYRREVKAIMDKHIPTTPAFRRTWDSGIEKAAGHE